MLGRRARHTSHERGNIGRCGRLASRTRSGYQNAAERLHLATSRVTLCDRSRWARLPGASWPAVHWMTEKEPCGDISNARPGGSAALEASRCAHSLRSIGKAMPSTDIYAVLGRGNGRRSCKGLRGKDGPHLR